MGRCGPWLVCFVVRALNPSVLAGVALGHLRRRRARRAERLDVGVQERRVGVQPFRDSLDCRVIQNERSLACPGARASFPTPKHLASLGGHVPANDESAGDRRAGKTRKGKYVGLMQTPRW